MDITKEKECKVLEWFRNNGIEIEMKDPTLEKIIEFGRNNIYAFALCSFNLQLSHENDELKRAMLSLQKHWFVVNDLIKKGE